MSIISQWGIPGLILYYADVKLLHKVIIISASKIILFFPFILTGGCPPAACHAAVHDALSCSRGLGKAVVIEMCRVGCLGVRSRIGRSANLPLGDSSSIMAQDSGMWFFLQMSPIMHGPCQVASSTLKWGQRSAPTTLWVTRPVSVPGFIPHKAMKCEMPWGAPP